MRSSLLPRASTASKMNLQGLNWSLLLFVLKDGGASLLAPSFLAATESPDVFSSEVEAETIAITSNSLLLWATNSAELPPMQGRSNNWLKFLKLESLVIIDVLPDSSKLSPSNF